MIIDSAFTQASCDAVTVPPNPSTYRPPVICPMSTPLRSNSPPSCMLLSTLSIKLSLPVLVPTLLLPSYSCLVFCVTSSPWRCSEVPEAFCWSGAAYDCQYLPWGYNLSSMMHGWYEVLCQAGTYLIHGRAQTSRVGRLTGLERNARVALECAGCVFAGVDGVLGLGV